MTRRAGIYLESLRASLVGGATNVAAALAQHLRKSWQVELVVRRAGLTVAEVAAASGTDLDGVGIFHDPVLEAEWPLRASREYDLFCALSHWPPPICPAPRGLLIVLFPTDAKSALYPWNLGGGPSPRRWLRQAWHERLWRRRFAGYQAQASISEFTRRWVSSRWGIDTGILFPPVDVRAIAAEKTHSIVSVGRFAGAGGVNKHQLEMLQAFERLRREHDAAAGWSYATLGGLGSRAEDRDYFDSCRRAAEATGAEVLANVAPEEIRRRYAGASLFWHAAGLGADESLQPEHMEHFGIVTVEAMARGAVPIVIRRGGQPEIVRDGETGLLWDSLDELVDHSARLILQPARLRQMAHAARTDAQRFSLAAFEAGVDRLLGRMV